MERTIYRELPATRHVWEIAILLGVFLVGMLGAVVYTEHHGHIVTGMNNQVVWGLPHVFAIFLIVAASGALNVASIASVFGQVPYKPMSRLSGLLAISLLAGGLAVLVLDLGRPDRLIIAMTYYNFTSIFAWNVILYTGFMVIVGAYLVVQMNRSMQAYVKLVGFVAFVWRLALTTGTGSIFGWLVARSGYDAAVMAPLFIAMSFAFGLAMFILVQSLLFKLADRPIGPLIQRRMGRLLAVFCGAVLYVTVVRHLTNLYAAEHVAYEKFILLEGGIYTTLFWFGQVLVGGIAPILVIFHPTFGQTAKAAIIASILVVFGGFAQLYVIVIGGQAFPMEIFPGYEVSSTFHDGVVNAYTPAWPEIVLGLGGVAIALVAVGLGTKILRILPTNLSDVNIGQSN
ncbi:MAG TPA: molybdopterin oxidoreductase [Aliiroseovarius sp.]|nr:molybdopterin oxidoreductase [Aliiroseovarius sp.]